MSIVAEIKAVVKQLPGRQKRVLARWLQAQVDDRLSDAEMMAVASEGARELDRREESHANRKSVRSGRSTLAWRPRFVRPW